ncbi:MAG TPA: hypothetical protein ACFE0H_01695 [Elainellaceae cyanobacterium]|jgi:hypothetical protein
MRRWIKWSSILVAGISGATGLLITDGLITRALVRGSAVEPDATGLESLLNGDYVYEAIAPSSTVPLSEVASHQILLRKAGHVAIGMQTNFLSQHLCFKGFIEGNQLVDTTRVLPPYTPDAQWHYDQGNWLDLDDYHRRQQAVSPEDRAAFETCLLVFSR